jgi:hypothetical protein
METTDSVVEMDSDYDFSAGTRGKYIEPFASGTNLILLDPDVAQIFSDWKQVNDILRALIPILVRA